MVEPTNMKPIPKVTFGTYNNQRYTVTHDPNASPNNQWVWQVNYVETFKYYGATPTMHSAILQARRKIKNISEMKLDEDERSHE